MPAQAIQRLHPVAEEFHAPVCDLADAAVACMGAGWRGTVHICSDGGLTPVRAPQHPVTTAGIAVAPGAEAHHCDAALSAGVRFAGHASSFYTELVGLHAALWMAWRLLATAAAGAMVRCFCDSMSALSAIAAHRRRRRAPRGRHFALVARCAMLAAGPGGTGAIELNWTPAHTGGDGAEARLNELADAAATAAKSADVAEEAATPAAGGGLVAAVTVRAPGVVAEARAIGALRRVAAAGAMAALRANHPRLPAAGCHAVHCAAFRVSWKGLRPVPAVGGCTSVVRDLLRRARGGGFRCMLRARGADGAALCHACGAAVDDATCWDHAVLCEGRGAAPADPVKLCTSALRRAAGRRVAVKLAEAAAAVGAHFEALGAALRSHKAALLDPAALLPWPAAPLVRRAKPPLAAAWAAVRAAVGAVRGCAVLSAETTTLLADDSRRGAVLAAVLPAADARRGDGTLLAALGVATAERAAIYLRGINPYAAPTTARMAAVAAVVVATAAGAAA